MLNDDSPDPIKIAALSALGYFTDDHIPDAILDRFSTLSARSRARSIELLCSRPSWALKLAESIDRKTIPAETVSRELVQRLRQYDDPRLLRLIEKNWGKVRAATPFETQGRINAVLQLLAKGRGDAARGRPYFRKNVCELPQAAWIWSGGRSRPDRLPSARIANCSCKTSLTRARSFVRNSCRMSR